MKSHKIGRIFLIISCIVFFVSITLLALKLLDYRKNKKIYKDSQKYIESENTIITVNMQTDTSRDETDNSRSQTEIETDVVVPIKKFDYDDIRKISNTIGWLSVPYCNISYPIVQSTDNDYYLDHAYTGEHNSCGSIFLDYRQDPLMTDNHIFIYGHSMLNGTMFGMLRRLDGTEYFNKMVEDKKYQFYIYLKDTVEIYEIFSIADTSSTKHPELFDIDNPVHGDLMSEKEYIKNIMKLSHRKTGVVPIPSDKFVTLYTCQNSSGEERHLVTGRLLQSISIKDFSE